MKDQNAANTYLNRGNARYDLCQYAAALRDYGKAIRLKPNAAEAYYNRGLAKVMLDRTSEAKQDYRTALRLAIQAGGMDMKTRAEKRLRLLE